MYMEYAIHMEKVKAKGLAKTDHHIQKFCAGPENSSVGFHWVISGTIVKSALCGSFDIGQTVKSSTEFKQK